MVQSKAAAALSSDDESDGDSYVVVAASSTAAKKRKREERGGSQSSQDSSSTRPAKKYAQGDHQRAGSTASASQRKPAAAPVKVRKGGSSSQTGGEDQVAAASSSRRSSANKQPETEEDESDAGSVVVSASNHMKRPSSSASAILPHSLKPSSARQNGHHRKSPSINEASGSQSSNKAKSSKRQPNETHQRRSSQIVSHPRIESLTRQDSQDRIHAQQKKDKGKQREVDTSEIESSRTNGSASKHQRSRRTASPEHVAPTQTNGVAGPSNAEKRLQKQVALARQRQEDIEDRFNEATSAKEMWQARATKAEERLSRIDQVHQEEIAKMRRRGDTNSEEVRSLEAVLREKDRSILIVKARTDEIILEARHREKDLRDRHALELQKKQYLNIANQKSSFQIQAEMDDLKAELENKHHKEMNQLREDLMAENTNAKLAVKEREIERLHARYQRQINDLNRAFTDLQARTQRILRREDPEHSENAWPGAGPLQLPTDVQELQQQLQQVRRNLENQAMYFEAQEETYAATIAKLREAEAQHATFSERQLREVETKRAELETEVERLRIKFVTAQEQATEFRDELKKVRTIRPEYEILKEKNPELLKDNTELVALRKQLLDENTTLRSERHRYVEVLAQETQEKAALAYEVEELRRFRQRNGTAREDLDIEQREAKADRVKAQRDMTKLLKRNNKLKKEVARLQNGSASNVVGKMTFSVTSEEEEDSNEEDEGTGGLLDGLLNSPNKAARLPSNLQVSPARAPRRSLSPEEAAPPTSALAVSLRQANDQHRQKMRATLKAYEATKPVYFFPPHQRARKADTRVPRHKTKVYMRSECHTPYVPDENVSDSDDEFLEWESQIYARSQARNPDREAAVVNVCWNRHVLDARGTRVRSHNLEFCTKFVQSFGPLIASRQAEDALLKHLLGLVKLGQLTTEEGSMVMKAYRVVT